MAPFNNYGYDIRMETPEEREKKKKALFSACSRIFIAASVYLITATLASVGIDLLCAKLLSEAQYKAYTENSIILLIVNALAQYALAFPIFFLIVKGMRKSEKTNDKKKLSAKDFIMLVFMAYALMFLGSLIGNSINSMVGSITGSMPENSVDSIISQTPAYVIFIFTCILAPIFEELIFRKLIIDRLSLFGELAAVIFSAVAFGLFHGNLYQFFYAAFVGALFGFVYVKTKRVEYTILLHAVINFLGSVAVMPMEIVSQKLSDMLSSIASTPSIDTVALFFYASVMAFYTAMSYGLIGGGIMSFMDYLKKKKFRLSPDKEIFLPDGEILKHGTLNPGTITFFVISLISMILSIIAG